MAQLEVQLVQGEFHRITFERDEALIITVPERLTAQQEMLLYQKIHKVLPRLKVLVLDKGAKVHSARPEALKPAKAS
jgi:hypothetical protein